MSSPIIVHHLENSRSQRVLWLLEELGVPYEVKHYARDPNTLRAPMSLTEVHPLGKSPTITDGSQVIAESGAIIEYLVAKYGEGQLRPKQGTPEQHKYTYFLHYAEGSLMPLMLLNLVFNRMSKAKMPFFARPVAKAIASRGLATVVHPQIWRNLDFLEGELTERKWFAGSEFSAADIQMSFPLEAAAARGGLDASRPKLWSYLERIRERPAYIRALEQGGEMKVLK